MLPWINAFLKIVVCLMSISTKQHCKHFFLDLTTRKVLLKHLNEYEKLISDAKLLMSKLSVSVAKIFDESTVHACYVVESDIKIDTSYFYVKGVKHRFVELENVEVFVKTETKNKFESIKTASSKKYKQQFLYNCSNLININKK